MKFVYTKLDYKRARDLAMLILVSGYPVLTAVS